MTTNTLLKIKPVVARQLPEFVRSDHSTFVSFLEAYYEWLETEYGVISPGRVGELTNIETTVTEFIDVFRSQYLRNFPKILAENTAENNTVSIENLVKNAKDFYRTKGSEASFKFLFRLVFGVDVQTYLPKTDILVASGSNYIRQISIKITNTIGDKIFLATGKIIKQVDLSNQTTLASARCERVITYREGTYDIAELFLANIKGTFASGYAIQFTDETGKVHTEQTTYSVIQGVTITNPGSGYAVGDSVIISGSKGVGAIGEVSRVGNKGEIKAVRMIDFGVNYKTSDGAITVSFVRSEGNTGELIRNGSFEYTNLVFGTDISFDSPVVLLSTGDNRLQEWNVINQIGLRVDNPFSYDSIFQPFDGIYAVGLTGNDPTTLGGIEQTIETVPGRTYRGSFYLAGNIEAQVLGGDVTRTVRFSAGLDSQDFSVTVTQEQEEIEWVLCEFNFTATSRSTIIRLQNATTINTLADFFFSPIIDTVSVVPEESEDATGTVDLGPLSRYEGFYESEQGHLSTNKVLQDNVYYQPYSYVLKSEIVISRYRDMIKNLVHPAGFAFFGSVYIERCFQDGLDGHNEVINIKLPLIANYTPYTLAETTSLDDDWPTGYLSPFDGEILSSGTNPLGFPFWEIFSHPNVQNIDGISAGISFGSVIIGDFIAQQGEYFHACSSVPNTDSLQID